LLATDQSHVNLPNKSTDKYEKKKTGKNGNVRKRSERRERGRNLTDNKGETIDNMQMKIKILKI
jgi:hypothetical protein